MKIKYTSYSLYIFLIGMVTISSCKNEVEIFAPESDVTLIYGLLNPDDTLHQLKINKVFQGEKAISELAQDPTVSEYDNINARVVEFLYNGFDSTATGREWTLQETLITNKDSGYFYYPDQKIYEFSADLKSYQYNSASGRYSSYAYKVLVDKLDDSPIVESATEIIGKTGDILLSPIGLTFIGLGLADEEGPIKEIALEMKMPVNTKVIEVYLDFTWRDEYNDGSMSAYKTISYRVGTYSTTNIPLNPTQSETVRGSLIPTAFYEFIAANVPELVDGDNIKQRIPNQPILDNMPLKFRYVMGGGEFNTYLEVASPSTSILETKPEYTNVKNGVGLFSTRAFDFTDSKLSKFSWDYLVAGEITAGRGFCDAVNNTSAYSCY